ncbi:MAG: BREX protein BrxB domain-containing protein [Aeromonas hydrophila]
MGDRLSKLIKRFTTYISVPWRSVLSAEERAVFVVYHKEDELKLRARVTEFQLAVEQHGHRWQLLDITDAFPKWMGEHDYADAYFAEPELLVGSYEFFAEELAERLKEEVDKTLGGNDVVALLGTGTLFGFASVSGLVKALSPVVKGKLVVFFPGEYHDNNFSLLDAKDGWGYHATAICHHNE